MESRDGEQGLAGRTSWRTWDMDIYGNVRIMKMVQC